MSYKPVLGRFAPSGFGPTVGRYMREQAERARAASDPNDSYSAQWHLGALEAMADYLATLSEEDQRLRGLCLMQSYMGGNSDNYTPPAGGAQAQFCAVLGTTRQPGGPERTLDELVCAAAEDLAEHFTQRIQGLEGLRAKDAPVVERVPELERQLAESEAALEAQDHARALAEEELARTRDKLEFIKAAQPRPPEAKPKPRVRKQKGEAVAGGR